MNNETIVCRCSDITLDQVRDIIASGVTDLQEIKRITRLGMGRCQGKTCMPIVMRELANFTGQEMKDIAPATFRPPVRGIKLGAIADHAKKEGHHE